MTVDMKELNFKRNLISPTESAETVAVKKPFVFEVTEKYEMVEKVILNLTYNRYRRRIILAGPKISVYSLRCQRTLSLPFTFTSPGYKDCNYLLCEAKNLRITSINAFRAFNSEYLSPFSDEPV